MTDIDQDLDLPRTKPPKQTKRAVRGKRVKKRALSSRSAQSKHAVAAPESRRPAKRPGNRSLNDAESKIATSLRRVGEELRTESGTKPQPLARWDARRTAVAAAIAARPATTSAVTNTGVGFPVAEPWSFPFPLRRPAVRAIPAWIAQRRVALAIGAVLLLSGLAHSIDLLHYPYLQQDEGTYFSDAWAVFHLGRLSPYTYFYDHAPLGWIQIGLWQLLTSWISFGYSLASGRVLMVLFQLGSALLVIGIGRRATGRLWVGLLAAALMSLEPYSIQYQRQILLDNIATFWLLLSVYALTGPITLRRTWLSATSFALAVLSKEVAFAAFPVLGIFVWRRAPREIRLLGAGGWIAIALGLCSTYVLMALLKGELFIFGASVLGGRHAHVSLLCSIEWQASRGGGSFLNIHSQFWQQMGGWVRAAPLLVIGGTAGAIGLATFGRRMGALAMIGWVTLAIWLFIGRSGVVASYYLLPLVPFLALAIAGSAHAMSDRLKRHGRRWLTIAAVIFATVITGSTALAYGYVGTQLWTGDQVSGQLAAERWITAHIPHNAKIVIDMSMWQDLHNPPAGVPFRYAEYYWKAAEDPAVRDPVFGDNWRNVDYVITTPELIQDTYTNGFPVVDRALEHSQLVTSFANGGWTIEIRRVRPHSNHVLFRLPQSIMGVSGSTTSPNGCMTAASR